MLVGGWGGGHSWAGRPGGPSPDPSLSKQMAKPTPEGVSLLGSPAVGTKCNNDRERQRHGAVVMSHPEALYPEAASFLLSRPGTRVTEQLSCHLLVQRVG